ncbi:MAG: glycosyltransferase family 4 protein [Prevotella sp.]|nr:glycosyltransferase family 4 protein [Prevotella sp.]
MAKPTIIGYDAKRIVRNGTGLGSYGRTLVNDLSALSEFDLRLYAPDKGMPQLRSQIVGRDNVSFCYPANAHTSAGKALWRTKGIVKQLVRDEVDIYHGLSGELPKGISESGIRSIVTIHDLIFMRHPEYYNKMDVKIYTRKFQQTLREADRIVAISECTRRDISELGEIDASRIDVIYQSCAPRFNEEPQARKMWQVRDKYELPDRYVLNVGSIEERKNVILAVKALHHLPDDVSLVIVGRQTPYSDEVHEYVLEHRMHGRVQMLHNVPDDDLPALYRMADCFVYPSRYEGFGIPIIEAISQGLPVVACTGSCLEEAGGPDSLYVGPDDPEAMAHAISRVLFGAPERQQRIELSRQYIRRFENSDAARHFADLYQEVLAQQ